MSYRAFTGVILVCVFVAGRPVAAQIEGVVTLKTALKEMLQTRGAKSLRKNEFDVDGATGKVIQKKYGIEPNRKYTVYTGLDAEKNPVAAAVIVDVEGKEGPLQLVVAMEPDSGRVIDLGFTLFGEERGKPAAKKGFLAQFIGFDKRNRFELGRDVDGVTGATMTSMSVAVGVRHAVSIFDHFILEAQGRKVEAKP